MELMVNVITDGPDIMMMPMHAIAVTTDAAKMPMDADKDVPIDKGLMGRAELPVHMTSQRVAKEL